MPESEDEDLGFGGWRDWLLVLVGVPLFLAVLVAAVGLLLGNRRKGSGPIFLSLGEAAAVVVAAVLAAVAWRGLQRWWRG